MKQQLCGNFDVTELPDDAQQIMIDLQILFQRRLGKYDPRLSKLHPTEKSFTDHKKVMHNLDMALHEAHEAYDMLEGGWKHHKKNPVEPDWDEVLMELVDVLHFLYNAYIFMGGMSSGEDVARSINACTNLNEPYRTIELRHVWPIGTTAWDKNRRNFVIKYDYGDGAYGSDATKECATRVLRLIYAIQETASTIKDVVSASGFLSPASGFVYYDTVPWVMAAAASIPGCTPKHLYSAFLHKNNINNKRQDNSY